MNDTQLLQEILRSVQSLEIRFDGLEKKVDRISGELAEFKLNQKDYNTAMGNISNQAFTAIKDVRAEIVSPWKIRQSKTI